ncbi:hypothetical protein BWD42_06065 [Sphingobacterium sp. CZ-UAM]|uniref:hypothetical protein n=1 Tax=unclassified Sphingobacterium TaxID=2609468 RepID=UPI0009871F4C|nr:hypothetical protein [Sphingobacterium sp. CZ-UAM]OOG19488.1 hypothetical protein BWD42_06065 [Sphingobacterium sp. CZ-UAM]
MEKTLQHSIVKQGLIILYYFSNRWYRKCLFTENRVPASNTTTSMQDSDEGIVCPKKDTQYTDEDKSDISDVRQHLINKKPNQSLISKKTTKPKENED